MTALAKSASDTPRDVERIVAKIDALTSDDLQALGVWDALAELSSHTELEAIGTDEAGVVIHGDHFEAVTDLYLMLRYGVGKDGNSLGATVLATITGRLFNNDVALERMTVDTSSF